MLKCFDVPNTEEGRYFLHLLEKFSFNKIKWKKFGRGPNKLRTSQMHIPLEKAKRFAVYLDNRDLQDAESLNWRLKWKLDFIEQKCREAEEEWRKYHG